MKTMRISFKLYLSFGLLLGLLLVMSAIAWKNTTKSQNIYTEYADQVGSGIRLSNAERGMWELRFGVANFMSADDIGRQKIIADGPKWYHQVEENIKAYTSGNLTPEEKSGINEWNDAFAKYKPARERWFEIYQSGKKEEAAEYRAQNTNRYGAASVKALSRLIELQKTIGETREKEGLSESRKTKIMVIWLIGISFVLGMILSIIITRSITRPLNQIIAGLTDGSDQVASAAGQISSSSQSLAEGTSEQASSLEETSASLEEMSSMTKQNADHANQAKAMMSEAHQIVEKVNRHMEDMAGAIVEITRSSEETGKIIKTIDEIAFQTNLLALNAAVEAARAGEAGAGFAVVADEVRNLAIRASEAAKNTSNLIENTIKAVRKGNELTNATQEAFEENTIISRKIGQLVDEIATASEEQSHGITQVNIAVAEMDKVTQSTAASAEESAAAAEELNAQAEQMKVYVDDLVRVVGGSSSHMRSPEKSVGASQPEQTVAHKAPEPPEKKGTGRQRTARGKASKEMIHHEQVIPMNDREFRDF